MAKKKITQVVEEIMSGFLADEGYELYNSEFVKEGRDWFLRVYVDLSQEHSVDDEGKEKYISTEDCEKISRYLSDKLDEEDPVEQNYYLEVSSPGMDRPLLKPEHYERYMGKDVEIKLYKGIDGKKNIEGKLAAFAPSDEADGGYIVTVVDYDEKEWNLKLAQIAKARLAVIF